MIIKNTVIFDMDGLMIDSETMTYKGYREEMRALGHDIDMSFYHSLLGSHVSAIEQKFKDRYGEDFPFKDVVAGAHRAMNDSFQREGVPLKDGLLSLLNWLRGRECVVGVATSSDRHRVDNILGIAGIGDYFDFVICGNEVARHKPDPEVFLKCCEKVGCDPEQAIVLEDSEAGIKASHTARITCIAVPDLKYPGQEYAEVAYRVAASLHEALAIMEDNDDFRIPERK